MYLYPGDVYAALLHVRSMDNRTVDVAADLEATMTRLVVGAARASHLGALEAEHALVRPVLRPVLLAGIPERGFQ